jgi:hypothetical protein
VISVVLGVAFDIYRRLWLRSIVVAGLVFAIVSLANALAYDGTKAATLVTFVLSVLGGLLVQGALVEVVRDLHESREPAPIGEYYRRTRGRLGTLLGAAVLYAIGFAIGLVLLVVPGLIAIARWSLVVPLVVIEKLGVREAFSRSNRLVKGKTPTVLLVLLISGLMTAVANVLIHVAFSGLPTFASIWLGGTIASAVTVPYTAHVLTVLYYKLTEPDRLVLPLEPPRDDRWRSVWDEEPPA